MKTVKRLIIDWQGLVSAAAFSSTLLVLRMHSTGKMRFAFLVWNLFLAYVPLFISYYLYRQKEIGKLKLGIFVLVWLLFLPNAPYIISDLMHLANSKHKIPWLDSIMVFSFALTALMAGIISLLQIRAIFQKQFSPVVCKILITLIVILTGYGIYLGRFERWNSWDILTNPEDLFFNCIENLTNTRAIAVTLAFAGCLFITLQLIEQASKLLHDPDHKISE